MCTTSFKKISKPKYTLKNGYGQEIIDIDRYKHNLNNSPEELIIYRVGEAFGLDKANEMSPDELYEAFAYILITNDNKTTE
jgi:hypothetical protein